MRNLICAGLLAMCLSPMSATAQDAVSDSLRNDSLLRRVEALEAQVNSINEDKKMEEIWKRKKFVSIMYGWQTLTDKDYGGKYKSSFAIGLQPKSWYIKFHKKPIYNVLRIGFDIAIDINFAKYKESEDMGIFASEDDEYAGDYEEDDDLLDIDMMQVDAGLALGPSFQVAPFANTNGGARHLMFFAYYHLTPSYSGIIYDSNWGGAFCLFNGIGFGVSYKAFSLGYECRFGSAKYDVSSFDGGDEEDFYDEDDESLSLSNLVDTDKVKFKTTTSRLFLRLNF